MSGLHEGVTVGELDEDSHGNENIDSLDGSLVEGVSDDGGVDVVGEEVEALLEEGADDDDDGGGAVAGSGVLGLGELDKHLG